MGKSMTLNLCKEKVSIKNCEMKLDGNILTITVDISVDISKEFGKSSSGKASLLVRLRETYQYLR